MTLPPCTWTCLIQSCGDDEPADEWFTVSATEAYCSTHPLNKSSDLSVSSNYTHLLVSSSYFETFNHHLYINVNLHLKHSSFSWALISNSLSGVSTWMMRMMMMMMIVKITNTVDLLLRFIRCAKLFFFISLFNLQRHTEVNLFKIKHMVHLALKTANVQNSMPVHWVDEVLCFTVSLAVFSDNRCCPLSWSSWILLSYPYVYNKLISKKLTSNWSLSTLLLSLSCRSLSLPSNIWQ